MRHCNQCHRITSGEPLFCNFCGSSYDVKLCPARHVNPRNADVCSQCGSRDFSTPAPPRSLWIVPLLWLASLLPGAVLVLLSVLVLIGVLNTLLTSQQLQFQLVIAVLMISLLWYCYLKLPKFLRDLVKTIWRKSKKDGHTH
jgi:RNA polymerase subunit RPABC4/transcription elongation factor Spt4